MPKKKRLIKSVFVFANGMVAVCDQYGQQIAKYQGNWYEKKDQIMRHIRPDTEINVHPDYSKTAAL